MGRWNLEKGGRDAIVPGEPKRLLLCRYWGMNHGSRSLRLAKRKLIADRATVRLIADGLNDLPPFSDGTFSCPVDERRSRLRALRVPGRFSGRRRTQF
jgi:hypothetical protein